MTSWTSTSNTERTINDGHPRKEVTVRGIAGRVDILAAPPGTTAITIATADVRGPGVEVTDEGTNIRITQFRQRDGGFMESLRDMFVTHRPISAHLRLVVPADTRLSIRTVSAPVLVQGIRGTVDVNTTTGSVNLIEVAGDASVRTVSGDITASGVTGNLKVNTVTGRTTGLGSAPRSIRVKTVSGAVALDVTGATLITTQAVSANVTVRAPLRQGFDLTAQSVSGHIVADGDTLTGGESGARSGHRADGDRSVAIKARSVSGNIVLVRGSAPEAPFDGPPASPIQDTLPSDHNPGA